jgi:hypothetical protein
MMPPVLSEALISQIESNNTKQVPLQSSDITDEAILAVDVDSLLDHCDRLKEGQRIDGPLSREQLEGMFQEVTLPNGQKAMNLDLKGTPLEGHEEALMKQLAEFAKRSKARTAGSSSRSA